MPQAQGYTGMAMTDRLGDQYEQELAQELCGQFEQLSGLRGNWEEHWREIAERLVPKEKNMFNSLHHGLQTQGEKRNEYILDSTPVLALRRFGAILDSLLTPRNSFWHSLKPSDTILLRDKNTMDWFQKVNSILFEYRYSPGANFPSQNQSQYMSLGSYGTGGMFIDPLAGQPGIRYRNVHLSELYLQENHQGLIDRVCRYFSMTARQAVQKFGDNCPEPIREKAKTHPESPSFFLHWVLPRADRDPERRDFKGMEYASYYIAMDGKKIVAEGGYRTFPYAVSRYEQAAPEAYGRSPAMDALPAIKTLNEQKYSMLKQGQMASDPVLLMHDDGVLDGSAIEPGAFVSGGVSADGRLLVQPLPVGRLDINKELMQEERNVINDTFLVTLFQILVETPQMSATEVLERTREKAILLAPTIGRQQSEYLGPMIDRELDVLSQQGLLPPMPRMLAEAAGEYTVQYDSPITRTQKAEWAAGATRSLELALRIAEVTQDPSKLMYFNFDKMIPEVAEIMGTPSSWLNTQEVVNQFKQQMAQQQQQQQAIQAAPAVAGMIKAAK